MLCMKCFQTVFLSFTRENTLRIKTSGWFGKCTPCNHPTGAREQHTAASQRSHSGLLNGLTFWMPTHALFVSSKPVLHYLSYSFTHLLLSQNEIPLIP